jgi:hypothetical protein
LTVKIPYELEHDGIAVTLRGQILNTSSDMYYGASLTSKSFEFVQLRRELEMPGRLEEGSYDFAFSFKTIDLEVDSYLGVDLQVEYSCSAEMVYTGSMMKYTCKSKEVFAVINYQDKQH